MSEDDGSPDDGATDAGATRLGRRAASSGPVTGDGSGAGETRVGRRRADSAAPGRAQASAGETGVGRRRTPAEAEPADTAEQSQPAGPLRFGPGVPGADEPIPGWGAAARPAQRRRGWIGGLITLGLIAGVLAYLLLQGRDPVAVTMITVTAQNPPGACDVTVDVVGTVTTNGRPGTFVYQWLRSDGQTTAPQTQSVASGQTSVPVVLQWSVSGRGTFDAQATLRILEPSPGEGVGGFTYSCR